MGMLVRKFAVSFVIALAADILAGKVYDKFFKADKYQELLEMLPDLERRYYEYKDV